MSADRTAHVTITQYEDGTVCIEDEYKAVHFHQDMAAEVSYAILSASKGQVLGVSQTRVEFKDGKWQRIQRF